MRVEFPHLLLFDDPLEVETHTPGLESRVGGGKNGDEEIEQNDESHDEVDGHVDLSQPSFGLNSVEVEVPQTEGEEEYNCAFESGEV